MRALTRWWGYRVSCLVTLPNGDKGCWSRDSGEVVRGVTSGCGHRRQGHSALSFIRKDEVRKLAGVLAGLVVLQKLAGDVW